MQKLELSWWPGSPHRVMRWGLCAHRSIKILFLTRPEMILNKETHRYNSWKFILQETNPQRCRSFESCWKNHSLHSPSISIYKFTKIYMCQDCFKEKIRFVSIPWSLLHCVQTSDSWGPIWSSEIFGHTYRGSLLVYLDILSTYSVQSLSCVWLFVTAWTAKCQASLSITNSQSLLKLMSIKMVMTSYHLIFCHPLLLLPSIFPNIRGFSSEPVLHIRWPK